MHGYTLEVAKALCDRILENGSKSHIFISIVYIYHCRMKSCIFHGITWNSMLKLLKEI